MSRPPLRVLLLTAFGPDVATDGGLTEQSSGTGKPYSRWWYGVVLGGGLQLAGLIGQAAVWATFQIGSLFPGPIESGPVAFLSVLGSFLGVLASIFFWALASTYLFAPIVVFSIVMDAQTLRAHSAPWQPNPYLWGAIGSIPIVLAFTPYHHVPWTLLSALAYLVPRHSRM